MTLGVFGLGTAVPPHAVTQEDAAQQAASLVAATARRTAAIPALYRRSGVRTRHIVFLESSTNGDSARQTFYRPASDADDLGPSTADRMRRYATDAPGLAAAAAGSALADAGTDPDRITHLVTVGCSGFSAPGVDIHLIQRLGLRKEVARTHVGFMGCHGVLNGLRVASGFASADPRACVLVCAVELCSLHHQYAADAQQLVANALFSDGAAALVGAAVNSDRGGWRVVDQRSVVLPDTEDLMSWHIGDHGFRMTLSPRVPDVIREHLGPWLQAWLARHDLDVGKIRSWAIHPGGPRILSVCAEAAGFDSSLLKPSQDVLAEFGNMSSPTVLFILDRLRSRHESLPCVALAFGPGLTIEAALMR